MRLILLLQYTFSNKHEVFIILNLFLHQEMNTFQINDMLKYFLKDNYFPVSCSLWFFFVKKADRYMRYWWRHVLCRGGKEWLINMIFWILIVLFTLFMYFLNKTIIAYKEDVNYKKYLYISSLTIYIFIILILAIMTSTLQLR